MVAKVFYDVARQQLVFSEWMLWHCYVLIVVARALFGYYVWLQVHCWVVCCAVAR